MLKMAENLRIFDFDDFYSNMPYLIQSALTTLTKKTTLKI